MGSVGGQQYCRHKSISRVAVIKIMMWVIDADGNYFHYKRVKTWKRRLVHFNVSVWSVQSSLALLSLNRSLGSEKSF